MTERDRKRRPKLSDEQLCDIWNVRPLDHAEGELKHLDKLVSSAVARCLADDNRADVAEHLTYLLGDDVTVHMLNSYSSEARRSFRISASRFLALIATTRRFDVLDAVLREIGGKALDQRDSDIYRVGVKYVASLNADRFLRDEVKGLFASVDRSADHGEKDEPDNHEH